MSSMQRIAAVTGKELRQLSRDRLTFGMVVMIPLIQLLLFGYAINTVVRDIPIAIVDLSGSALARAVTEQVNLPPGYTIFWSGQYEYMVRAKERLSIVGPVTLAIIVLLLYLNFRRFAEVAIIIGTLPMALIGGLWLLFLLGYLTNPRAWHDQPVSFDTADDLAPAASLEYSYQLTPGAPWSAWSAAPSWSCWCAGIASCRAGSRTCSSCRSSWCCSTGWSRSRW